MNLNQNLTSKQLDKKYEKFVKKIQKFNREKAVELLEKQLKDELYYPIQERILR
jgi:hypothetical protein